MEPLRPVESTIHERESLGAEVWQAMPAPSRLSPPLRGLRDVRGAGTETAVGSGLLLPCALHAAGQPRAGGQPGAGGQPLCEGLHPHRSPGSWSPGSCTGVPSDQHDLGHSPEMGDGVVGLSVTHCWRDPCPLLAGTQRPTSAGSTTGAVLGVGAGSRSPSSSRGPSPPHRQPRSSGSAPGRRWRAALATRGPG